VDHDSGIGQVQFKGVSLYMYYLMFTHNPWQSVFEVPSSLYLYKTFIVAWQYETTSCQYNSINTVHSHAL